MDKTLKRKQNIIVCFGSNNSSFTSFFFVRDRVLDLDVRTEIQLACNKYYKYYNRMFVSAQILRIYYYFLMIF